MSRVEHPDYLTEAADGPIEVRRYGPMIVAEAVVAGERKAAISTGFRLIAAYIFGANTPKARIEMTAPVAQQKQTIAMTAPVTQQSTGQTTGEKSGQSAGESAGESWSIRFVMPKSWTMQTLPAPEDPRVVLHPMPERRFVAITFSGRAPDDVIEARTADLRRYAADHKLTTTGEPVLAFYNPPWTLPFIRRNEIMLEIASR